MFIENRQSELTVITSDAFHKKDVTNNISQFIFRGLEMKLDRENDRIKFYNQTYNNIEIYDAIVKIGKNKNGNESYINDNSIKYSRVSEGDFPNTEIVKSNYKDLHIYKVSEVYFPISANVITPAVKVVYKKDGLEYLDIVSDNKIIYTRALSISKKLDSKFDEYTASIATNTAKASVFSPDPITSSKTPYASGTNYAHNNGASNAGLEAQQISVDIDCKLENGIYYLENNTVKIVDFTSPNWGVVTSTDGNFNYVRSQVGFQQVNAFYHISEMKKYLDAYGFGGEMDYVINVDADGENGDDNSHYHTSSRSLEFGAYCPTCTSGMEHVPDAEDSQVVIHEYGHAISHALSNSNPSSLERRTIEKATADYIAVSYSTINEDTYKWENIFKWDAHNEFWVGRIATSTKKYDELSFTYGTPYDNSDVWVAPLMEMFFSLGKQTTDKLLFTTIEGYTSNTTMEQAALLFIEADKALNSGVNFQTIFDTFKKYHILNDGHLATDKNELSEMKVINKDSFFKGGTMTIDFGKIFTGNLKLYNLQGIVVVEKRIYKSRSVELNSSNLISGSYIVNILNSSASRNIKVLKY